MSKQGAQSAVSISAFVVAAIFAYRKLTESSSSTPVPSVGHFVLGFGFAYTTLAIVAQAAPELGGMFAVLVGAGDLLANGKPLIADLNAGLKRTTTSPPAASRPATAAQVNTATGVGR